MSLMAELARFKAVTFLFKILHWDLNLKLVHLQHEKKKTRKLDEEWRSRDVKMKSVRGEAAAERKRLVERRKPPVEGRGCSLTD